MNLLYSREHKTELEDKKPEPDAGDKGQARTRKCLMCGADFPSKWAGERICRKCKSSTAWRRG